MSDNKDEKIDQKKTPGYLDHAGFYSRYLAFRIDILPSVLIMAPLLILILFYLPRYVSADDNCFLFFFLLIMGLAMSELLYFTILESVWNTVGKSIAGIKVVNFHGKRITWKQALKRNIERIIWAIPLFGQIFMYLSVGLIKTEDQRFGDGWANTYVVSKEQVPSEEVIDQIKGYENYERYRGL